MEPQKNFEKTLEIADMQKKIVELSHKSIRRFHHVQRLTNFDQVL